MEKLIQLVHRGTGEVRGSAVLSIAPPTEVWDNVLTGPQPEGDVVVPSGESWLIGAGVTIQGNLRTSGGVIAMRPGSSLRFIGAIPDAYVGGGMHWTPEFTNDIGLWVDGTGRLDIRGTPKVGWNYVGNHSTWSPTDEAYLAPHNWGEKHPTPFVPGSTVPDPADPRIPRPEVINVTRDIEIEGPGHILIHSTQPQHIEHVTLRRMGIVNPQLRATSGRYALHFHHCMNGSRGSIVRGVAAVDCEGRVFVPHASHGITFDDCVSVNSFCEGFWWDPGGANASNDTLVTHLCVSGVEAPRSRTGQASRFAGVSLQAGTGNEIRYSAVSGVRGSGPYACGYDWTIIDGPPNVWEFDTNLVSHNNNNSVRFWTNNSAVHVVAGLTSYYNGMTLLDGAYINSVRWRDLVAYDLNGIVAHASSHVGLKQFTNVVVEAASGPAVVVAGHNRPAKLRMEFSGCEFWPGPGSPKIVVQAGIKNPWIARFDHCGITPADIHWEDLGSAEGSNVIIEGPEGSWTVTVENGQVGVE